MSKISKIKLPDNNVYELKDSRISDIDQTLIEGSTNPVAGGAVYSAITENEETVAQALNEIHEDLDGIAYIGENFTPGAIDTQGQTIDLTDYATKEWVGNQGYTTNTGTLTGVSFNGTSASVSNGVASITATIPIESTISGWGFTKNTGTITGITMNDSSKGTSGVVDLGTVVTSETDPVFSASAASGITSTDITNWNSKTSNTGTVTGVKMNGTTNNPTSGIVDLGTVLTSESSLSKGTTSGSGNAVTDISVSGHQITLTKGTTFLTSHQNIKTLNSTSLVGTGNIDIEGLPSVTSSDNGKILIVSNGAWGTTTPTTIYSGTSAPSSSTGNNGDIYIQTTS